QYTQPERPLQRVRAQWLCQYRDWRRSRPRFFQLMWPFVIPCELHNEGIYLSAAESQPQEHFSRVFAQTRSAALEAGHRVAAIRGDGCRVQQIAVELSMRDRLERAARLEVRVVEVLLGTSDAGP